MGIKPLEKEKHFKSLFIKIGLIAPVFRTPLISKVQILSYQPF